MSETLSIRVPDGTKEKLDQIGSVTRRSRSFIAAEAVARYVDEELAVIEGIEAGLEEVRNGKTVSHDAAMARLEASFEG